MNNLVFILSFIVILVPLWGYDEIRLAGGQSEQDQRHIYPHRVLKAALDATIEEYGSYTMTYTAGTFTRDRALIELRSGEMINVHEAPTREEWENTLIPIRIPVRKGLLGYRLFLINDSTQFLFTEMDSINQLKQLTAGLGVQWSTTRVMNALDFSIVTGINYEGLFGMLSQERFQYFPRGINEIFGEYESRRDEFPHMVIESSKALYFPTPSYFFVSPEYPELAERIERGMNILISNGTLDTLFIKTFSDDIERANLSQRTIFHADNPLLSDETPLHVEEYWFSP